MFARNVKRTGTNPVNQEIKAAIHGAYAANYDRQVRAYGCYLAEASFGLCYEFIQPGQNLLDLGIGSGLSAALFARAGLRVHGMDFSPAMLEICQAKGIAEELKQHDIQQIPWPYLDKTFDHLVCCGVLHFIPELEGIFGEASRVLEEGGLFVFTTKCPTSLDARQRNYDQQTGDGLDVFAHSPEYLKALLEQAHFARWKVLRCFVGQDIFYIWTVQKRDKSVANGTKSKCAPANLSRRPTP